MPHLRCAQGKVQARGLGLKRAYSINPNTNREGTASKLCLLGYLVARVGFELTASGMRQLLHTSVTPWLKIVILKYGEVYLRTGGLVAMREKIEAAIDRVRPALQADGGNVELVEVKDGVVSVRLTGACGGCPMATITLKNGIECIIREEVPGVKEVVAV
jgi:Fe-S cluster biogenesis protein NfuA